MSGVASAIIGSSVIGAGASILGGRSQAKANRRAQDKNRAAQDEANRLNYRRFLESRGVDGSAVLPLYFREGEYSANAIREMSDNQLLNLARNNGIEVNALTTTDSRGVESINDPNFNREALVGQLISKVSQPFEAKAAKDAMAIYNMGPSPEELAGSFGEIQDRFRPAQAAADDQILGVFSGAREDERLSDFGALAQERLNAARLQKEALQLQQAQQMNQVAAQNQRKGYVGTGFGQRLAESQVGQQIAGKSATADALARLKNAQERFQIQDQERDLRLQNVGQVGDQAARAMGFETAAQRGMTTAFKDKFSVTDPFKIGTGSAPSQRPFETKATTTTGALVGKAVGDMAGTIGTAYGQGILGGGQSAGMPLDQGVVLGPGGTPAVPMSGSGGTAYTTSGPELEFFKNAPGG